GMRTPDQLTAELLSIGAPAMTAIVIKQVTPYSEPEGIAHNKAAYLAQWDKDTQTINQQWAKLSPRDFSETFNLFGQYEFPVIQNILYFIDNEIHHRGQLYVYLRGLNIEPPFFWER
ncbi:MAG TPA: DinB family protein, partial [Flavobacterium sp.]|nr:DinB family protein [Flavobacterium sp.]